MRELVNDVFLRYVPAVQRRARRFYLRALGAHLGRGCWIGRIEVPRHPSAIALGDEVALDHGVVLLVTPDGDTKPRISIGDRCYINRHTVIDASQLIEIGRDCMIGPFCYITDHDHGKESGRRVSEQPLVSEATIIGDDVWIGAGAVVLKGVTLGAHSVVAAGAVVTRSVDSGVTVAGVPARPIGARS